MNVVSFFFFFNDTATTEIYTLSLHDALPISVTRLFSDFKKRQVLQVKGSTVVIRDLAALRSEEHTSELQSRLHLVCRLLLEKKKKAHTVISDTTSTCAYSLVHVGALIRQYTD